MGLVVELEPLEEDGGGGGDPGTGGGGTPAAPTPPTQPGTKIALQVSSTNATITADQIIAAGGPWPSFKVRVTPLNANGAGLSATYAYPQPMERVTIAGDRRVTQDGNIRIEE
jgi:hypothetical protein